MSLKKNRYYVYILLCKNKSFYIGYTIDIERRFKEHLAGTAKSKYTRSFKAVKLLHYWQFTEKKAALQIESLLKKLSRLEKEILINAPEKLYELIGR